VPSRAAPSETRESLPRRKQRNRFLEFRKINHHQKSAIFITPGKISTIVPFCSHTDHSEHSVHIVVTEQGMADLRGLIPAERARRLIDSCAHPAYRDYLHRYVEGARAGHIRHDLARCFELHRNLIEHGAMLPELDLNQFAPACPR
jgi:acyl-CoA hydrolase